MRKNKMSNKKRTYTSAFKTKIVLEALREDKSIAELSVKYNITPKNIHNWKATFLSNAEIAMEPSKCAAEYNEAAKELNQQVADYAKKVARNISSKKTDMGILVCGSGTGMAMSANKFRKIRAAVCYNSTSTRLSRTHNNANILAIGSRLTRKNTAIKLVNIFLSTKFEGGRHLRRVKKI